MIKKNEGWFTNVFFYFLIEILTFLIFKKFKKLFIKFKTLGII